MPSAVALIVTKTDEGFEVLDSLGRPHRVSAEGLSDLCNKLVNDPALPEAHVQDLKTAQLEFAATQITQKLLPDGFEFLARPALLTLRNTIEAFRRSPYRSSNVRR